MKNRSIPNHIAIIMDGNRRWAERKGLKSELGHAEGGKALERIVRAVLKKNIPFLSFYCFSTENWQRSEGEVNILMNLLRHYLKRNFQELVKEKVRVKVIGMRKNLPADIVRDITKLETLSLNHQRLTLCLAINYGARAEIINAFRMILQKKAENMLEGDIDEEMVARHLWTSDLPDPDMIVRSSGEYRLSNFFLWQGAYSELIFTDRLWPDIDTEDLDLWLKEYQNRQRRFGGTIEQKHEKKKIS